MKPKNVQEDVRGKTKKKTKKSDIPHRDAKAIENKIRELFARNGYEAGKSEARNREMANK